MALFFFGVLGVVIVVLFADLKYTALKRSY